MKKYINLLFNYMMKKKVLLEVINMVKQMVDFVIQQYIV